METRRKKSIYVNTKMLGSKDFSEKKARVIRTVKTITQRPAEAPAPLWTPPYSYTFARTRRTLSGAVAGTRIVREKSRLTTYSVLARDATRTLTEIGILRFDAEGNVGELLRHSTTMMATRLASRHMEKSLL